MENKKAFKQKKEKIPMQKSARVLATKTLEVLAEEYIKYSSTKNS